MPSFTPVGSDTLVNSETVEGQIIPRIFVLAGGHDGNMVQYVDSNDFLNGNVRRDDSAIVRFSRDSLGGMLGGTVMSSLYERVGDEVLVNTTTNGSQGSGRLAALPGGGFVSIWIDGSGTGGDPDASIKGQLFDSNGNKVGSEFLVNSTVTGNQTSPSVSALSGGRFVVTWQDFSGLGGDEDLSIKAQVFSAAGEAIGGEVLVNTTTANSQQRPVVTGLNAGGFIISWQDFSGIGGDASGAGIKAQLFDSAGNKVGGEFLVNTTIAGSQADGRPVALHGDGFGVIFQISSTSLGLQIFDAAGAKVGGEQVIASGSLRIAFPRVAALSSGFVVTWEALSSSPGVAPIVYAQLFDALGVMSGGVIKLAELQGSSAGPIDVTSLPGGGFLATFSDDLDPDTTIFAGRIFGQVVDASGQLSGSAFAVNSVGATDQILGSTTTLISGDVAVVWSDIFGGSTDIVLQRLTLSSSAPSDILLDNSTVSETAIENLPVAVLSVANPALNASPSFQIMADSTGGAFGVVGNRLVVVDNGYLDFEHAPTAQITVRATNENGQSFDKIFVLTITDAAIEERYTASALSQVNTSNSLFDSVNGVIALSTGGYLVTYGYFNFGDSGLRARIFDSHGTPVGSDFLIYSNVFNQFGNVAALPNGRFVVTYDQVDSSGRGVAVQRYDGAGEAVGAATLLARNAGSFYNSTVASLGGGGFVVVWEQFGTGGSPGTSNVRAQLFDASGIRVGGDLPVNSAAGESKLAEVAPLADGGFVIVWRDFTAGTSKILGQRFDQAANKVGSEFVVLADGPNVLGELSLTVLDSGQMVVGWVETIEYGGSFNVVSVGFQLLAADGQRIGNPVVSDVVLVEYTTDVNLVATAGGGFLMSWTGDHLDGGGAQSFARYFDPNGAPVGDIFIVSHLANIAAVARLTSGDLALAWSDSFIGSSGGYESDAYSRLISAAQLPAASEADDVLSGSGGNDLFLLQQGGDDVANGARGDDGFFFGATFNSNDKVDGGAGTLDQIGLQGDYSAGVTLSATSAVGIEQFVLLPGSDTRFGVSGNPALGYNLITGNAAIAAGQQLVFQANTLRAGENFTLDASGELDGSVFTYGGLGGENLRGSQNGDSFFFGSGRFNASDVVDGQGGSDQIGLQGTYSGANAITFGATQLANVEFIVCLSNNDTRFGGAGSGTPYSYTLTMNDGNVVVGSTLIIQANALVSDEVLTFNGAAELDGHYTIYSGDGADSIIAGALADTISGRGGADNLTGGGGNDSFLYTNLTDSIAATQDHILDFTSGDILDLSRLDAVAGEEANDAFTFIGAGAFTNTAGQLRAVNTAGNDWLVEADVNGDGVADLSILVTVADAHVLSAGDFSL